MKVLIVGYEESTDTFIYEVLYRPDAGCVNLHEQRVTGSELYDLSAQMPTSFPGQFTRIEMLLGLIHDAFWVQEPSDLIGQSGTSYSLPAPTDAVFNVKGNITSEKLQEWADEDSQKLAEPTRIKLTGRDLGPDCVPLNSQNLKHLKGADE